MNIYIYTCIDLDTSICHGLLDHLLPLFNLQTARMQGFSSNFGKSIDSKMVGDIPVISHRISPKNAWFRHPATTLKLLPISDGLTSFRWRPIQP